MLYGESKCPLPIDSNWTKQILNVDPTDVTDKMPEGFLNAKKIIHKFLKVNVNRYTDLGCKSFQKDVFVFDNIGIQYEIDYFDDYNAIYYLSEVGKNDIYQSGKYLTENFLKREVESKNTNVYSFSNDILYPSGNVLVKNEYVKGQEYLNTYFYKNGDIAIELYYNPKRLKIWDIGGALLFDSAYKSAPSTIEKFYESGELLIKYQVMLDIVNGQVEKYDKMGKLIKSAIYQDGVMLKELN